MHPKEILEEVSEKIHALFKNGAVQDIEKNIKAVLASAFDKMNLVSREEFDMQQRMLQHVCEKIDALEQELSELKNKHSEEQSA